MIPEVRIISVERDFNPIYKDKIMLKIIYYSQYDSPHICTMCSFVSQEVKDQLFIGEVFNTYKEFFEFLKS